MQTSTKPNLWYPGVEITRMDSSRVNGRPHVHLLTAEQIKNTRPRPWLAEGLIQAHSLVLLAGAPGVYKSFLALGLGLSVASGQNWLGRSVKQGPVVYVDAEYSARDQDRIKAWEEHTGVTVPPTFLSTDGPVQMHDEGDVQTLLDLMKRNLPESPALVIVDTLNRTAVGLDENDAGEMSRYLHGLERIQQATGATVLVIHHTGRSETKKTPRGSTALDGHIDAVMIMRPLGNDGSVTLENTKQRHAPLFESTKLWPRDITPPDGRQSLVLVNDEDGLRPFHYVLLNRIYSATKPLGYEELIQETGKGDKTVRDHVKELVTSGHLKVVDTEGRGRRKLFGLTSKNWGRPAWEQ